MDGADRMPLLSGAGRMRKPMKGEPDRMKESFATRLTLKGLLPAGIRPCGELGPPGLSRES